MIWANWISRTLLNWGAIDLPSPRVAIIAPYLSSPDTKDADVRIGGVERYVTELAKALSGIQRDVTLITPSKATGRSRLGQIPVIQIKRTGIVQGAPLFNPLDLLSVIKGFDIVHTQATYPLFSDQNPVLARVRDIPSVVTYHFEPTPTSSLGRIAGGLYEATLARMTRWSDRIILSTESYKRSTRLLKSGFDEKIRYVPMGVDTGFFAPDPSLRTEPRFLFVGRLVPYKDIPLLIKAMEIVNRTLPSHELAIVGTGELEDSLKAVARESAAKVRFLGRVDDAELLRLYRTSTAMVLASHDHQEAFGMTLVESMSCGTPVIAARIPGVMDVASVGGTVVDPESADALAEAMIAAASSTHGPEEKVRLHSIVEDRFSWRSVASRTSSVYDELL